MFLFITSSCLHLRTRSERQKSSLIWIFRKVYQVETIGTGTDDFEVEVTAEGGFAVGFFAALPLHLAHEIVVVEDGMLLKLLPNPLPFHAYQ